MILAITLIWLFSNTVSSFTETEIDFNPRLFQKEVSILFNDKTYRTSELSIGGSTANGSRINGKFFALTGKEGERIMAYIGRVHSCRTGGCSNQAEPVIDFHYEYFDYFILFDALKKVRVVRVFNYEATHGQEVAIKKWLDQFAGYDGSGPLRAGKEIDSISGATISVSTIIADIKEKTMLLNNSN